MAYKQQVIVSPTWSNTTAGSTATRPSTTTSRPQTGSRWNPKTVGTSLTGSGNAEIICAISESRGISPTIGLCFVSLSTSEAILCQFTDTQTYARTCQKIKVFAPSEILYMSAAEDSKLIAIVVENLEVEAAGIAMTSLGRHFWSEPGGLDYVQCLAFPDDLEVLKLTTAGNYYATCCFSAVCLTGWRVILLALTQGRF
jgi:DNA mismatch repair protein MSH4